MTTKHLNIQTIFTLPVFLIVIIGLFIAITPLFSSKADVAHAAGPEIACSATEVNIVAHQDDDILFMNPDIQDSITQKRCVETVFLTAGENDGTATMTREEFAASRIKGTRAAYATMANVADEWTRTAEMINGRLVEVATLNGAPNVKLIYLNIRDGGDDIDLDNLTKLYKGTKASVTTIVPADSPAGIVPVSYGNADLRQTLLTIMRDYKATTVRTQDYHPDPRLRANHKDHVHGALFAITAARSYAGINGDLRVNTVTYRDYNMVQSPVNVSASQKAQKNKVLDMYKAHDSQYGLPASQDTIAGRMYYRWPVAPTWVAKNKDGRLQAFDVQNGRLVTWKQNANGSWSGLQNLGNSWLQPGIAVAMNTNGTLQVFAVKQIIDTQGAVRQDVQYIQQTAPNGAFSSWKSLGNPGHHTATGVYDIGSPSVALNADGRIEIFLKDSNGNLSTVYKKTSGAYSSWVNLGGSGALMETPASILRKDGKIEIFAATRGVVKHWIQRAPNSAVVYDSGFTSANAVGTPSAGFNQDGRTEIFYRRAGSGEIYTVYQLTSGKWSSGETRIGGQVSQGAPAVINNLPTYQSGSRIMLFSRKAQTGYEMISQWRANASFSVPWKTVSNSYSQHAPAAILDANNKIHLMNLSQDGVLTDIPTTIQP